MYKVRLALSDSRDVAHSLQTQAHLPASLKRREAVDAAFEAQFMALLPPVKARLAEQSSP
jgi:hypothetical protein